MVQISMRQLIPGITPLLAFCSILTVWFLWGTNWLCFSVLSVIAVLMLLLEKSKVECIVFLLISISGAIAEITAIYFKVWQYNNPSFLGIPLWLPLCWGLASVLIIRLYNFFSSK